MGALDHAAADVDRGGVPCVDVEVVDAGGGADDVDDGIYSADFVEVNVVDGDVVDFRLGIT